MYIGAVEIVGALVTFVGLLFSGIGCLMLYIRKQDLIKNAEEHKFRDDKIAELEKNKIEQATEIRMLREKSIIHQAKFDAIDEKLDRIENLLIKLIGGNQLKTTIL